MIPDQWYVVANSKSVKKDRPLGVRRLGEDLVLWRTPDGKIHCHHDRCAHKGAKLSLGKIDGATIACPYHGFRYDASGTCVAMPCLGTDQKRPNMSVRKLIVREAHDLVWLWWGAPREKYPALPITPDLIGLEIYGDTTWERPVHYTRYVESLLEFYHIAHVHSGHWFNYIDYMFLYGTKENLFLDGRKRWFSATKVANYECNVDGSMIESDFDMVIDGDPRGEPITHYNIRFMFPNLVRVVTGAFAASVWMTPIDDDNTVVFLRWDDQVGFRWMPFKPARRLVAYMMALFEEAVQDRQDVRVMRSQTPKSSAPGVSRLVPVVDEMNARYLTIRERLIREASERQAARPDVVSIVRTGT